MGLITTLIGNYSRSKMEEQAQKTSEIQQRIQANQSILKDPTATPEAKQFAQTDITRLLYQHGGPEGKKHAPTIGTILGTLAGTMGEMAGRARPQQAPPAAGAPPRLYMTPEEIEAQRQKEWQADFDRKKQEAQYGMATQLATRQAGIGQDVAQRRTEQQEAVKWFDDNREALKRAGHTDEEIEDMKMQVMAPSGVKFREAKRTPVIVTDPSGIAHNWTMDDRGTMYDANGQAMKLPDGWRLEGKVGTAKAPGGEDMSGQLKTLFQAYRSQGKSAEEAKRLAARDYLAQFGAGLATKELNLEVEKQLADISGVSSVTTAPGEKGPAPPVPEEPPKGPIPEKGAAASSPQDAAAIDEFVGRALGLLTAGRDKFSNLRARRGLAILEKQTGMSETEIYAAVQQKKDTAKALSTAIQRTAGVESLQNTIKQHGKLLIEARANVNDQGIPVLNRWIQAGKRAVTGDPAVARLDLAVNALAREYARLASGGFVSNAMPHVSSQEDAKEKIAGFMTDGTIGAVVDQLEKEAAAERKAQGDLQQDLLDQLKAPIGGAAGGGGGGGGAPTGGGTGPAPRTADDYLKRKGLK